MLTYDFLLKRVAGSVAVLALAATAAAAAAPDVTVTDAKIAAGKLVITGKTATPRTKLRLDGKSGADFNVTSKADKSFSFSLVYLPKDCVVTLEKLSASAKAAGATELVVANCAPTRISPRGVWTKAERYDMLDLVTHRDASWLARRDNAGTEPSEGSDWQLFAARSDAEESSGDASGDQAAADDAAGGGADAERVAQRVPPTGPAGGDLNGTYPNPTIRNGAVSTNKLSVGAVTQTRLANASVVASKIGLGAIVANKISANAVLTAKIANLAVTTDKIASGAITNDKLGVNSVNSARIIDGSVASADIADGAVTGADIADGAVGLAKISADAVDSARIVDGSVTGADVLDETLTDVDLAINSVGQSEIQTDGVAATEIADNSIDSGEIVDFGLTNQDVGVLFAEVSAAGVLDNSSGGVTVVKLGGLGNYEVDFGLNVAFCTAVATVGPSGAGSSFGEINLADRSGNVEAVFVDTNGSDGAAADKPFRLVVVC